MLEEIAAGVGRLCRVAHRMGERGFDHLAGCIRLLRSQSRTGILAYLDTRMTNGPVEGINNKFRVIARRAYGFHSPGPLISMLYLCCGGIELAPPLPIRV